MLIYRQSRTGDIAIRLIGLLLLVPGALALRMLYQSVHASSAGETTALELGLAAASFVCASLSSLLLVLGRHVFDEVAISPRWASRPGVGSPRL